MNSEAGRLATFSVNPWPHPPNFSATPVKLSKSGFYFSPSPTYPDRVICFCCGVSLVQWKKPHDPWNEHCRRSPVCGFVTGKYRAFLREASRLESFRRWNVPLQFRATPQRLSKCGFYHSPDGTHRDRVVCFCCGLSLVGWEENDDPWDEHMKHSTSCQFVIGSDVGNVEIPSLAAPAAGHLVPLPSPALSSFSSSPPTSAVSACPHDFPSEKSLEEIYSNLEKMKVDFASEAPSFFICPITQDVFRYPVVAEDGYSYDREAIISWLNKKTTSPITNKQIYSRHVIPNLNLRTQLVEWAEHLVEVQKKKMELQSQPQFVNDLNVVPNDETYAS